MIKKKQQQQQNQQKMRNQVAEGGNRVKGRNEIGCPAEETIQHISVMLEDVSEKPSWAGI